MLRKELYSILISKKTYIVFGILLAITFYDLWINFNNSIYGQYSYDGKVLWDRVSSPPFMAFLSGRSEGHITAILYEWMIPLYLLVLIGDSYVSEYKSGAWLATSIRSNKKQILYARLLATFIVSFTIMFLTFLMNYICCLLIFSKGTSTPLPMDFHIIGKLSFDFPYITYIVYMILDSIIMALCGVMCSALSFCIKDMKYLYATSFLIWLLLIMLPWSITYVLQPFIEYGLKEIVIALMIFVMILGICIYLAYREKVIKDEF